MKYIILEKAQAKVGHVIMVNDGEEAEVTAVGEDGVTARDEKGKKFQVMHDHVEVKGKGVGKEEEDEEPGKKEKKPGKEEPDLEVADDEEDKESEEEKTEKKPPKKKVVKKEKGAKEKNDRESKRGITV